MAGEGDRGGWQGIVAGEGGRYKMSLTRRNVSDCLSTQTAWSGDTVG